MKSIFSALFILLFFACKEEKNETPTPFRPAYLDYGCTSTVNINGSNEIKYLKVIKCLYQSFQTALSLEFINSDPNFNYYYSINFAVKEFHSGIFRLSSADSTFSKIFYNKYCCYSNPDESYWHYVTNEPDSINNLISINIDSLTQSISGSFKATLIPYNGFSNGGPDTVWLNCDTFSCGYTTQHF